MAGGSGRTMRPFNSSSLGPLAPKNCAIRERAGGGESAGRCYFYVGNDDQCPRHGDVSAVMEYYRATGKLTDEKHLPPQAKP